METKIIINGNKVIFEGHAGNTEECRTLSAMCEVLNASDNFNTIKLESGYAEFEQVAGGETMIFTATEARLTALEEAIAKIRSCTCDPSKYASADEFDRLKRRMDDLENSSGNSLSFAEMSSPCVDLNGATITFIHRILNDIPTFQQLATDFYSNNSNLFTLDGDGYKLDFGSSIHYCLWFKFYLDGNGVVTTIKHQYYSNEIAFWDNSAGFTSEYDTWYDFYESETLTNPSFIEFISKCCSIQGGVRATVNLSDYHTKSESDARYAKAADVTTYASLEGVGVKFKEDTSNLGQIATNFYNNNKDLFYIRDYGYIKLYQLGVELTEHYSLSFELDEQNNVIAIGYEGGSDGFVHYWDSTNGVNEWYKDFTFPVYGYPADALRHPAVITFFMECFDIEGGEITSLKSYINNTYSIKSESDAKYAKANDVIKYTSVDNATVTFRADVLTPYNYELKQRILEFYLNNTTLFTDYPEKNAKCLSCGYGGYGGLLFILDDGDIGDALAIDYGAESTTLWSLEEGLVHSNPTFYAEHYDVLSNQAFVDFIDYCCVIEGGQSAHLKSLVGSDSGSDSDAIAEKIAKATRTANDALYFSQQGLSLAQEGLDKAEEAFDKAEEAMDKAEEVEDSLSDIKEAPKVTLPYTASELLNKLKNL